MSSASEKGNACSASSLASLRNMGDDSIRQSRARSSDASTVDADMRTAGADGTRITGALNESAARLTSGSIRGSGLLRRPMRDPTVGHFHANACEHVAFCLPSLAAGQAAEAGGSGEAPQAQRRDEHGRSTLRTPVNTYRLTSSAMYTVHMIETNELTDSAEFSATNGASSHAAWVDWV